MAENDDNEETTTEDDDEGIDTEAEFRQLYHDVQEQSERLAAIAKDPNAYSGALQPVFAELADTVMELLKVTVATTGGAIEELEARVAELEEGNEPTESFLLEEDAQGYLLVFEQILRLLTELESALTGDADSEQREIFATLRRVVEERVKFTKEISGLDEGDEDEEEEEEPPPSGDIPTEH